ncbi:MAG: complex I NDUFA9 subunit family protein [Ectothiorhodospiraceae bacterium]|nr:complex I NDUFA9 subunit family protein [Ectothiorhodospiraceae bacterium]
MNAARICLIGGSGFVGRHLAARLVRSGYEVKVLTRRREDHRELLVLPNLTLTECNIFNKDDLCAQLTDMDVAVNLVGILNERRKGDFQRVHVDLSCLIIEACQSSGVKQLLHMSALKADGQNGPSQYLRTKGEAETAVLAATDIQVTAFRPSVIFGPDDLFFNRFAQLLAITPGIFPLACANARFAPVYVEDVAEAFVQSINNRATYGQAYELCGPSPYSLRELVDYTAKLSGNKRLIINLGDRLSWWQGRIMEYLPGKPFSRDNFLSTRVNSLCKSTFPDVFDITPASIESIVPGYLGKQHLNARYSAFRSKAGR